jgi:hypothetical protein
MEDTTTQRTKSNSRLRSKAKKDRQNVHVLVALHETEAVLSLSCGAITADALVSRLGNDVRDHHRVECWDKRIPSSAVSVIEATAGYGGVIGFRLSIDRSELVTKGETATIALPIPLSAVLEALFLDEDYRLLFQSRVSAFPDVVLEAIPHRTAPEYFETQGEINSDVARNPGIESRDTKPFTERRIEDKVSGAIAGTFAGLRVTPGWTASDISNVWSALSSPLEEAQDDVELLVRIASAVAGERPDTASLSFFRAVIQRLAMLGTQDGFEPEQFLNEVAKTARSSCDNQGEQLLNKFEAAGKALIAFDPRAPKDLLADGGSIILRGCLAFILNPPISRLEGMASKQRVGRRVGTLALMISGYYTGTTAMPRDLKARPVGLLLSLGDVIVARSRKRQIDATINRLVDNGGRPISELILEGRTVGSIRGYLPDPFSAVAEAVVANSWQPEVSETGIAFRLGTGKHACLVVTSMSSNAPIEPFGSWLTVECHWSPGSGFSAQSLEKALTIAVQRGVSFRVFGAGRSRTLILGVWIIANPGNADLVTAAVTRLALTRDDLIPPNKPIEMATSSLLSANDLSVDSGA